MPHTTDAVVLNLVIALALLCVFKAISALAQR